MAYPFYQSPYQQFGGYYPQGYQPAAQPQMVQPQQMQPTQMPVANQAPSTSGIIWVSGAQEAQMYPVAPNNAVALWENSGKLIYLKQADATGKPTMRIYELVERSEVPPTASGAADEKTHDYASREDVASLAGAVKGILGDIEQMKGDLYGVAGRKKTVKKEVTEDDA